MNDRLEAAQPYDGSRITRLTEVPPSYNLSHAEDGMIGPPPYEFNGVTMRFFPLRAKLSRLQSFCDRYLNLMPPEIAEFRPSLPYVFLQLINYGEMTGQMQRGGWVSQNELVFSIFLDWFRLDNGKYVFERTAAVAPFILVDQVASQATGREIFGWPKTQGWLGEFDVHGHSPAQRRHPLIRVKSNVFPQVFEGSRMEKEVILEIDYDEPPNLTQWPPNRWSPFNPFVAVSEAILNGAAIWDRFVGLAAGASMGGLMQNLDSIPARLSQLFESFRSLSPPTANTVNLKQFRDGYFPDAVCYQAIVNSQLQLVDFNAGGMLGDENLLRGDPSAGFQIRIHDYPTLPVLNTLGIEADAVEYGAPEVAVLKPDFPFWADVNMRYVAGENVCWRTRHFTGWWSKPNGELDYKENPKERPEDIFSYNTARGAAAISLPGPFRFPNATVLVLPLLASKEKMSEFVDKYLNDAEEELRFEVFGTYVYLLIWTYDGVWSKTDDIGKWATREIRFSIPVKRYKKVGENWVLASAGMVSPFAYNDGEIATTIGREQYGWPTVQSVIRSQGDGALELGGAGQHGRDHQTLMQLEVPTLSSLTMGQEMRLSRLMDIVQGDLPLAEESDKWSAVTESWGRELKKELERKQQALEGEALDRLRKLLTLGLEPLAHKTPINEFSLKQFRDAEEPDKACFQSIVQTPFVIERLHDLREIESQMHVHLYRSESQPIMQKLWLSHKLCDSADGVVYSLEPIRPFVMRLDLRVDEGIDIWAKTVGRKNLVPEGAPTEPPPASYFDDEHEGINVGLGALQGLVPPEPVMEHWGDLSDSQDSKACQVAGHAKDWASNTRERLSVEGARDAMEPHPGTEDAALDAAKYVEPQMAIECILSAEWGHTDRGTTSRRTLRSDLEGDPYPARQKPCFCVRRDSVGKSCAKELFGKRAKNDNAYRLSAAELGWYPGEEPPASTPAS